MLTKRLLDAIEELKQAILETDDIEAVVVSGEMVSYRVSVAALDTAPTEKILSSNPSTWYSAKQLVNQGGSEQAAFELAKQGKAYVRSAREDSVKYYMHRSEVLL